MFEQCEMPDALLPGFDPDKITSLPEPAQRWLTHAIPPNRRRADRVRLRMHGQLRTPDGRWRRFRGREQLTATTELHWSAMAMFGRVPVIGADRYRAGHGASVWRAAGIVPVAVERGPDVTRSAAGRLAAECVFLPTVLAEAQWTARGPDAAAYSLAVGGFTHEVTITVRADGSLAHVELDRWGNPDRRGYRPCRFAVDVAEEGCFGDVWIPYRITATWDQGNGDIDQFFRARIDRARFDEAEDTP